MLTIGLSEYTKSKLDKIKKRNGHTSIDSVVRTLLIKDVGTTIKCNDTFCNENKGEVCRAERIEISNGICKSLHIAPPVSIKLPEIKTRNEELNC